MRWGSPKDSYDAYADAIDAGIRRVVDSGWYVGGSEVEAFEREFAEFTGVPHAVACANGTDALVLALKSLGAGPGDVVVTVSQTAVATVAAIELAGATPALVDIDAESMTMSPDSLDDLCSSLDGRVKAVIPVHLYGHPADVRALRPIAEKYGAQLVEDCAQAHGARIGDAMVGSFGAAAAYSFYPTKNLGALGDGGLLTTADADVAGRARRFAQYGWRERYISDTRGMNSRLDPIQAAVLRAKLAGLPGDNTARRATAARYDAALPAALRLPSVAAGSEHVYHQYVVRTPRRDALREHCATNGVPTAILYPQAVHQQPAYAGRLQLSPGGLPSTEEVTAQLLCLPMHPQIETSAVDRVVEVVQGWANERV